MAVCLTQPISWSMAAMLLNIVIIFRRWVHTSLIQATSH